MARKLQPVKGHIGFGRNCRLVFHPCVSFIRVPRVFKTRTNALGTRMKPSQKNASLPSLRKPASKTSDSSIQPIKAQKNRGSKRDWTTSAIPLVENLEADCGDDDDDYLNAENEDGE